MTNADNGFKNILVATDFSECSNAALSQAVWLARHCGVGVVLAHAIDDLRRAAQVTSYKAKLDLLSGEGELFQKEIRSPNNTGEHVLSAQAISCGTPISTLMTWKP